MKASVHQQMNRQRGCGIFGPHQNGTQPLKKEWNFAICSNMKGLGQCYDKWSKSDKEREIPSEIIYMWDINNITN